MVSQQNDEYELRELLKRGMSAARTELQRDLWPNVMRRIEERPRRVPWFDWALAAAATACLVFFPHVIPALLNQF